jgi:hypothetical protein
MHQRTELTDGQETIFRALHVDEPPRYLQLALTSG